MASTCSGEKCTYDLSTVKAKSINCANCKQWYCMDCSKIPPKICDALFAANKSKEDISMIILPVLLVKQHHLVLQ